MTLISPASKNRVRICQVVESTRGTTPTNPAWKTLPHLESTALEGAKTYERSNEIKSNRMGGRQVGGNKSAAGTVAVPMKNDPGILELLESAFSFTWAYPTLAGALLSFVETDDYAKLTLTFVGNPTEGATITLAGIAFTFRNQPANYGDVKIGATLADSLANFQTTYRLNTDDDLADIDVSKTSATTLLVLYSTVGTGGNAVTVAWDAVATNTINTTVTGSTTLDDGSGTVADTIVDSSKRFLTAGFRVGHSFVVTSATTSGNDGTYAIKAISADGGTITLDRDIAAAETFASGTTITSLVKYGVAGSTRKFFSYEVSYLDLSPIVYEYYRGMEVNSLNLEIPTSGEVTGSFEMVGVDYDTTNTVFPLGSGGRTAAADVVPFAGSIEGASLKRGGVTRVDVESMSISVNNNRAPMYAVGQETAAFVDQGDLDIEMSASLYFMDKSVRQNYIGGQRMPLFISVKDQKDGYELQIEIPNAVITSDTKGTSGNAVTEQVSFFAEEDAVYGTKAMVWIK